MDIISSTGFSFYLFLASAEGLLLLFHLSYFVVLNYYAYFKDTNLMSKVNSELAGMPGNACEP